MRRFESHAQTHGRLPADLLAARRRGRRGGPLAVFARIGEAMADGLVGYVGAWRPDLIVHEPTTWAGPVAAAVHGIPHVRHTWGVDFQSTVREFEPEATQDLRTRFGLERIAVEGEATVDPCPPGLRVGPGHRFPLRHIPYNGPGTAPGWLLDRPAGRRVCVSWGTTSATFHHDDAVPRVLESLAVPGTEVVAAMSPRDRAALPPLPDGVRVVDMLPLHLALPDCDLLVSQGGAGTVMTGVAAGVPQLVVPNLPDQVLNAQRLAAYGAGLLLPSEEATPEGIRTAAAAVLYSPGHREAARSLRDEVRAQPAPAEVAAALYRWTAER
jgi:UDP:flavonoid glycosyltransferase YjiC (YdhE family)